METTILTSVVTIVGILQGANLLVLRGMKKDAEDQWKRINSHYHEVSCDNEECRRLKTGNVIIPSGQK